MDRRPVIADTIRRHAKRLDFTTADLAQRAQVNQDNLTVYLAGQGRPCPVEQRRLALALGITIPELLEDETDW